MFWWYCTPTSGIIRSHAVKLMLRENYGRKPFKLILVTLILYIFLEECYWESVDGRTSDFLIDRFDINIYIYIGTALLCYDVSLGASLESAIYIYLYIHIYIHVYINIHKNDRFRTYVYAIRWMLLGDYGGEGRLGCQVVQWGQRKSWHLPGALSRQEDRRSTLHVPWLEVRLITMTS